MFAGYDTEERWVGRDIILTEMALLKCIIDDLKDIEEKYRYLENLSVRKFIKYKYMHKTPQ